MRVNFSVTNQLATPSIHAAALANRPPAGQPGRLFVDTDNPSTGIYRDTGTVWENITGGAGASNLQTVTDAGNTTDNNILLTYADNTIANALVFYNDALTQEEYLIEKRGTGITTNDSLAIQSRGNISPSTNPVGFLIDGANDVIKSFYTTSYSEVGLKIDFANGYVTLGDVANNSVVFDQLQGNFTTNIVAGASGISVVATTADVELGDFQGNFNGTTFDVFESTQIIKSKYLGNDIGLKLDFTNQTYTIGDFGGINNYNYIAIFNNSNTIELQTDANNDGVTFTVGATFVEVDYLNGVSGISLDFLNKTYNFGQIDNTMTIRVNGDTSNRLIELGELSGNYDMTTLYIDDSTSTIKTSWQGADIGLKLDLVNGVFYLGDYNNIQDLLYFKADIAQGHTDIVTGQYVNFRGEGGRVVIGDIDNFNNNTIFGVDDTNQKLIATNNLLVGSSGSASGQHLKIKVGTTDYVIELKNP